jgi:hypothetical protein
VFEKLKKVGVTVLGSVEEIQTKILKRQEAAAKCEKAMAYALAHQRQCRI